VVTDAAAALDAQALLEACHAAGALEWSLAVTRLLAGQHAAAGRCAARAALGRVYGRVLVGYGVLS